MNFPMTSDDYWLSDKAFQKVLLLGIIYTALFFFRYTLLIGKPPFETSSLKETYSRIKKNEYRIPSNISLSASSMITK